MPTTHPAEHLCGSCHRPVPDSGTLCWDDCIDGRDGLRDLLSRLTARVIGAQTPGTGPLRVVLEVGQVGHGTTTAWDTPRGEAANLPRMLREATARQTRFAAEQGVRTRGSGEEPGVSVDHRAGDHLIRLQRVVARLALDVSRATGTVPPRPTWGAVARWLDGQMPAVRLMSSAPTHLADLRRVMAAAERHVDRPPTRLYLGPCDQQIVHDGQGMLPCPGEYRAREGEDWARCATCGAEVAVEARRADLREQASTMWLDAVHVEHLTALLGDRVPDSTVDAWRRRGHIEGRLLPVADHRGGGREGMVWHYLLGDVLARVEARRGRTRGAA